MTISINSGNISHQKLRDAGYLLIVHGGAGPADPSIRKVENLSTAIASIAGDAGVAISVYPDYFISSFADRLGQTSVAEKIGLHAAYLLENDATFNAGLGSALQEDGAARVSASYMDSRRMQFSAVSNVTNVKHPSLLAFALQSETFTCLDAMGAEKFSRKHRFPVENLVVPHRLEKWLHHKKASFDGESKTGRSGTIGAVAIDKDFQLVAITSTGGVSNETAGRVGDCPTVAGNYCTQNCAVSCTGWGEQIINDAFAARLCVRINDGLDPREAMTRTIMESAEKSHRLAAIAVTKSSDNAVFSWVTGSTSTSFIWATRIGKKVKTFNDFLPFSTG